MIKPEEQVTINFTTSKKACGIISYLLDWEIDEQSGQLQEDLIGFKNVMDILKR